jgi:membrane-bound lytic murein transglycosylase D
MKYFNYLIILITVFLNYHLCYSQVKKTSMTVDSDFLLPDKLILCGESMPLNDQWSWEMLDRELTIAAWDKEQVFMWLKRSGRYFPYIEKKLAQENMPQDLKYLSIAESSLLANVKSSKGAMGFWQFMPDTARLHSLRSDKYMDERRDLEQSTEAALSYLKRLKEKFGTWSLAMAAYNCGENRISKEINEQQEHDFYRLELPNETERYIFRIAAIKLIVENPEAYGYQIPEEKIYKPIKCDSTNVSIKKNIRITEFAKAIGTSYKVIRELNPEIIDDFLPAGSYSLNTPTGTGIKVQEVLKSYLTKVLSKPSMSSANSYIVQPGDTLIGISRKTGVALDQLIKVNNITDGVIKVGEVLYFE